MRRQLSKAETKALIGKLCSEKARNSSKMCSQTVRFEESLREFLVPKKCFAERSSDIKPQRKPAGQKLAGTLDAPLITPK